jgi:hypothetical protein
MNQEKSGNPGARINLMQPFLLIKVALCLATVAHSKWLLGYELASALPAFSWYFIPKL